MKNKKCHPKFRWQAQSGQAADIADSAKPAPRRNRLVGNESAKTAGLESIPAIGQQFQPPPILA